MDHWLAIRLGRNLAMTMDHSWGTLSDHHWVEPMAQLTVDRMEGWTEFGWVCHWGNPKDLMTDPK